MKQRRRIYYSAAQRAEIWDRWKAGESMSSIGRRFDRESSSVFSVLSPTGGIRPPARRRAAGALSLGEREEISRGLSSRRSLRGIARSLGRSASTISREVHRNGGSERYRATRSDQAAWDRALRPKPCKLACRPALARTVSGKLRRNWSPEQIAGWLKRTWPGEPHNQVSHETIYRSLFIQTRGVLKKELLDHLRTRRTIRRSRHATLKRNGLGQIKDAVSISERPASVEDRAVPGHWEGDLIGGSRNSYVATLVERHSRYVMLVKVANKDTESVVTALIKQSRKLPGELYKSLTWDRGKELADHKRLALAADVEVYFCDPRSPWQRGSNENTNRLLRQYLPHGTDLSVHSQAQLSAIARQLNERPRRPCSIERQQRPSLRVLQRSVEPAVESGRCGLPVPRLPSAASSGSGGAMFGRGKPADFDGDSLARKAGTIETREDFSQFAQLLMQNYKKRRGEWENDKLDRYLEAVAAFSSSYEGYVRNTGSSAEDNPWRMLATVLLAAKVYE